MNTGQLKTLPASFLIVDEAHLLSTTKEELIWIDSISDGTAYKRHPMEDNGRFFRVLEEKLPENIEDDGEDSERE